LPQPADLSIAGQLHLRHGFMASARQRGLKRVPAGMEVDHTVPLAAGGSDTPSNMQLLPKSAHDAKTAAEAKRCHWHKKR
jgi:5-methylcytosine-specific restriction endonuclease McrA